MLIDDLLARGARYSGVRFCEVLSYAPTLFLLASAGDAIKLDEVDALTPMGRRITAIVLACEANLGGASSP